jgi:hypothetical protein
VSVPVSLVVSDATADPWAHMCLCASQSCASVQLR